MLSRCMFTVSRVTKVDHFRTFHSLRSTINGIHKAERILCQNKYNGNKTRPIQPTRVKFLSTSSFLFNDVGNGKDQVIFVNGPSNASTNTSPAVDSSPVLSDELLSDAVNPTSLIENVTQGVLDPPFASLGLGGWTPVGWVQNAFEFLHVTMDVPWWGCIIIGTICVRILMFPLVIKAQRNAAKMNNHMPTIQGMQLEMTEARQAGNQMEAARLAQDMFQFMKEKDMNPLKNVIVPLAQAPLFISFFMGLREMANLPLESMKTGGLWWFTDLTVADPFYALPLITSATMFLTIELGTDSARLADQNMQTMKYVLRALPIIILPFTINFPGAILVYWVSTNFISLMQVGFLKIPSVRTYFNIEQLIVHDRNKLPIKPKPFVQGLKESWSNIKVTQELQDRERVNAMSFQKAGRGPLIKTYKHDPTKIVAKKKDS